MSKILSKIEEKIGKKSLEEGILCISQAMSKAAARFGGNELLASKMGMNRTNISRWMRGEFFIPAKRCIQIEKLMDGDVTRKELRPFDWHEIWPDFDK